MGDGRILDLGRDLGETDPELDEIFRLIWGR